MSPSGRETHGDPVILLDHLFDGVLKIAERGEELTDEPFHPFGPLEELAREGGLPLVSHLFVDAAHQGFVLTGQIRHALHSFLKNQELPESNRAGQFTLT
jgi:hypothetical protein